MTARLSRSASGSLPDPHLYHYHGPTSQQKRLVTQFNESLQAIPSFVPLNREESNQVAAGSGIAQQHFAAGEKVIRQGHLDNGHYIIVAGQAMMSVRLETGEEIDILPLRSC
jgi:hypothetical protein